MSSERHFLLMKKLAVLALTLPGQQFMPSLPEDDQEMPSLVWLFFLLLLDQGVGIFYNPRLLFELSLMTSSRKDGERAYYQRLCFSSLSHFNPLVYFCLLKHSRHVSPPLFFFQQSRHLTSVRNSLASFFINS